MPLICFNPIAGRGRGKAVAEAITRRLPGAVLEQRIAFEVEAELWAAADVVLAVGGDGTLRTVVSAMLAALPGELPPVGVVPLGTANLMAQHVGMIPPGLFRPEPLDYLAWLGPMQKLWTGTDSLSALGIDKRADIAAEAVRRGRVREIDSAETDHGLMLLMAGVGLDGHVIHALQTARTGPIRKIDYVPAALAAVLRYDFPELTVSVDGSQIAPPTRGLAFCANVEEYGTGFPLLPNARSDDGLLDVCVLPASHVGDLVKLTATAFAGEHHRVEGAMVARGKVVEIRTDRPAPVQIDGEAAGMTPLTIKILSRRIPMLCGPA